MCGTACIGVGTQGAMLCRPQSSTDVADKQRFHACQDRLYCGDMAWQTPLGVKLPIIATEGTAVLDFKLTIYSCTVQLYVQLYTSYN